MSESFSQRINRALKDVRGITVGGQPDRESTSMKVSDWMRAEAASRNGEVPTEEVMRGHEDEQDEG